MAHHLEKFAAADAKVRALKRAGEVVLGAGLGAGAMRAAGRARGLEGSELRDETLMGAAGGGAFGALAAAGARSAAAARLRTTNMRKALDDEIVAGARKFMAEQDEALRALEARYQPQIDRGHALLQRLGALHTRSEQAEARLMEKARWAGGRQSPNRVPAGLAEPQVDTTFVTTGKGKLPSYREYLDARSAKANPVNDVLVDALEEALGPDGFRDLMHRAASRADVVRQARLANSVRHGEAVARTHRLEQELSRAALPLQRARARAGGYASVPSLAFDKQRGLDRDLLDQLRARAAARVAEDAARAQERAKDTFFGFGARR